MEKAWGRAKAVKVQHPPAVRASISFPQTLYSNLEEIAKQKKVSLAWVVRDAVEKYITEDPPKATTTANKS